MLLTFSTQVQQSVGLWDRNEKIDRLSPFFHEIEANIEHIQRKFVEKWADLAFSQQIFPKSDRLLGWSFARRATASLVGQPVTDGLEATPANRQTKRGECRVNFITILFDLSCASAPKNLRNRIFRRFFHERMNAGDHLFPLHYLQFPSQTNQTLP